MSRTKGSKNKPKDQTMPTKTADRTETVAEQTISKGEVAIFSPPRLPFHPAIEERFGVDKGQWKVLVEAIFPAAKSADAIVMALAYCKSRNLDPFKRPVHIVPVWDSQRGGYTESVWPGISELRTTASRTKGYAGCDEAEFGPTITMDFSGRVKEKGEWHDRKVTVEFPEWCRITVYRIVDGQKCKFVGPKVRWLETYATQGNSELPNKMWQERPEGQLEKCSEAGALRRAFPEELGNELTAEEMIGRNVHDLNVEIPAEQTAGARDQAPPRLSPPAATEPFHDSDEARDGTPPRRAAKPAEPKSDPISSGPPRTVDTGPSAKPVEPFKIPGNGETFESWSQKFIDLIATSTNVSALYKWIDLNSDPLSRLKKGKPSSSSQVDTAIKRTMEALKSEQEKATAKAAKKAAAASDMDDGPSQAHSDANVPQNPEDILAIIEQELAAVEDADLLQTTWDQVCDPLVEKLDFPPDVDLAQACFDKHSRRLGGE